jgi:hypothetical protein
MCESWANKTGEFDLQKGSRGLFTPVDIRPEPQACLQTTNTGPVLRGDDTS